MPVIAWRRFIALSSECDPRGGDLEPASCIEAGERADGDEARDMNVQCALSNSLPIACLR